MSVFNLNERGNNNDVAVFNNGIAGKVENVTLEVTKKEAHEADNIPDYKVVFTDKSGAKVNQGFYYHKNNDQYDQTKNDALAGYLIDRILSIANTVIPEGFIYPETTDAKNAVDVLFKVIRDNAEGKQVNVFVTYGTKTKPSKYLGLRYFNFIEKAGNTGYSRLTEKGDDMMERMVEDAPREQSNTTSAGNSDMW